METQEIVATTEHAESKRDGLKKIVLGPNDSLEGKLVYDGHFQVDGGRAEGEFRVAGNIDVGPNTTVKALLEASNVTVKGEVEGRLTARDKLTIGRSGRLNGDVQARRLQIEDGATLNGYVRMGDIEQQAPGS
jgi:cytoskeletal protein CcmA (bactofilin family)